MLHGNSPLVRENAPQETKMQLSWLQPKAPERLNTKTDWLTDWLSVSKRLWLWLRTFKAEVQFRLKDPVTGSYKHVNKPSASVKGKDFLY